MNFSPEDLVLVFAEDLSTAALKMKIQERERYVFLIWSFNRKDQEIINDVDTLVRAGYRGPWKVVQLGDAGVSMLRYYQEEPDYLIIKDPQLTLTASISEIRLESVCGIPAWYWDLEFKP